MLSLPRLEAFVILSVMAFVIALASFAVWAGGGRALLAVRSIPFGVFAILLAMAGLNYAMRVARWLVFSRALEVEVPAWTNALYYVAGFAMTTTPGKIGEALRLWLLRRGHAARYESTAGLLIADRLADAAAMVAVVAGTVAWFSHYLAVSLVAIAVVGIATALLLRPRVLLAMLELGYRVVGRRARLFVVLRRAVRQLERLASVRIFGAALLLGILGWSSEGLSLAVLLHALGSPVPAPVALFIFAFAMIVGAISVLPGGLGGTEATMVGLLVLQGVALPVAIVATAVVRVTTLWFAVGLGTLALPLALHRSRPRVGASLARA